MTDTTETETEIRELDYVDMTITENDHEIRYATEIDGNAVEYWELKDCSRYFMQVVDEEEGRTLLFHENSHDSYPMSAAKHSDIDAVSYNDDVDAFYDIDNEAVEETIAAYTEDVEDDIAVEMAQTEVATIYARPGHGSDDDIVDEAVLAKASDIYNQYREAIGELLIEESTRRREDVMNRLQAVDIGSGSRSAD